MAVPPACQPIADQIAELEELQKDLKERVGEQSGVQRLKTLQQIVKVGQDITQQRQKLQACIALHAPGWDTDVVVLDVPGNSVMPYEGRLWRLPSAGGQVLDETRNVQGGRIAFLNGGSFASGDSIAVSIHDSPSSVFGGALFRSGPLTALPAGSPGNPGGLIETGIPDPIPPITGATITAGIPLPMGFGVASPVTGGATVTTATVTTGSGTMTLVAGGTAGISAGILGMITVPFTYGLSFSLSPSHSVTNVAEVVVVNAAPGTLSTPLVTGIGAIALSLAAGALEASLRPAVVTAIQGALNAAILGAAASAVGLSALPSGVVVSMRRVVITPGGVTMFPALGAFGGLLNKIPFP